MAPNHNYVLTDASGEPVSRTYQYRKVMKPMLERKRRARINRCLDELKELMTGALQTEGENVAKLEKADILELTVRHLQTLRRQNQLGTRGEQSYAERFKAGFRHCAAEVTHFLGVMDQDTSIHVLKHLNGCINRLESTAGQQQAIPRSQPAKAPVQIQPAAVNHSAVPRSVVPPVPAAVWMQKNGRPLIIQQQQQQQQQPQPHPTQQPQQQGYPGHPAMHHRQQEHSHPAAAAYYANRQQQFHHDAGTNVHMMESSTRINTPPMSPKIEVDDGPVWRPW